jgi:CHAP domain-containing protein
MIGSLTRIATVAAACALLSACGAMGGETELTQADLAYAHAPRSHHQDQDPEGARGTTPNAPLENPNLYPDDDSDNAPSTVEARGLQCVPYAREHSGIALRGDAYTWWDKAAGVYARGHDPIENSVMVLNGYSKHRAHVAVVRRIVSPREIRIDHANWLDDGAVYVNDPVVDVSENNDWTEVKVWNIRSGSWGTRTYHVQGFIGPGPETGSPLVAAYHPAPKDDPIARTIAANDDALRPSDNDDSNNDRDGDSGHDDDRLLNDPSR